nr:MAG TPA: ssDNA binding protein [Caudoviricetes sp.]
MSAKVIKTSEGMSARKVLSYTSRNDAIPMKELAKGTIIPFKGYIEQEIVNESTGEVFNSLLIISEPDESGYDALYATRSESVMRSLFDIIDTLTGMGDTDPFSVKVDKLKSKNGREFIILSLAD